MSVLYTDFSASASVKPINSLQPELWEDYAEARKEGFTDLGTYNPASKLPSGAPSDHAKFPAFAFDSGFSPATGWDNPQARKFFQEMAGRPEVNYVILGNEIWSRDKGLHSYTYGGHEGHVHVSGVDPAIPLDQVVSNIITQTDIGSGISDPIGKVAGKVVGGINSGAKAVIPGLGAAEDLFGGAGDALGAIGHFFAVLTREDTWIRVGIGVVGFGILFIGVKRFAS